MDDVWCLHIVQRNKWLTKNEKSLLAWHSTELTLGYHYFYLPYLELENVKARRSALFFEICLSLLLGRISYSSTCYRMLYGFMIFCWDLSENYFEDCREIGHFLLFWWSLLALSSGFTARPSRYVLVQSQQLKH